MFGRFVNLCNGVQKVLQAEGADFVLPTVSLPPLKTTQNWLKSLLTAPRSSGQVCKAVGVGNTCFTSHRLGKAACWSFIVGPDRKIRRAENEPWHSVRAVLGRERFVLSGGGNAGYKEIPRAPGLVNLKTGFGRSTHSLLEFHFRRVSALCPECFGRIRSMVNFCGGRVNKASKITVRMGPSLLAWVVLVGLLGSWRPFKGVNLVNS